MLNRNMRVCVYHFQLTMANADDDLKEAYFLRFNLLVTKFGAECLRKVFDREIPPGDLQQQLQNNASKINQLNKKSVINKSQQRLLRLPTTLSTHFDITLLVILLRNITNLRAPRNPPKLWEEVDNSLITGFDEVSDIIRIRNLRNEVSVCNSNDKALLFDLPRHVLVLCVRLNT